MIIINIIYELKVIKKSFDKNSYLREEKFYQTYKNSSSKLKLLKHVFLKENTIEIEFFKSKTLQRLINEGSINFEESLEHFNRIKKQINNLYKNETAKINWCHA